MPTTSIAIVFPPRLCLALRYGAAALYAAVVGARQLAPLGDDNVRAVQTLALPAVLLGVEAVHRLARRHVVVVEAVDHQVAPHVVYLRVEGGGVRGRGDTLTPGHQVAVRALVDR